VEYDTERPHSALGYRPPAPQAILPISRGMEIWKTLRVSRISTPRRRAGNVERGVTLTFHFGTKDRSPCRRSASETRTTKEVQPPRMNAGSL
jgi:hypothetical protein